MAAQSIDQATHDRDVAAHAAVTLTAQLQAASAGQADSGPEIATLRKHGEQQVSRLPSVCSLHTALPTCRCENMHSERV